MKHIALNDDGHVSTRNPYEESTKEKSTTENKNKGFEVTVQQNDALSY